jgi:CRP/FNR family transcriptional regulator, cyclic AMP receptor protein
MTFAEFAGYMAAGLVFATFYMKTMIPLRLVGITSNVAFLVYAWLDALVPVLVLHSALLPLNCGVCRPRFTSPSPTGSAIA